VVFYHNASQMQAARALGIKQLEPVGPFTRAEDYHQKYYLQGSRFAKDFYARYPDAASFTDSTAAARANAVAGGYLTVDRLNELLPSLGVSSESAEAMRRSASRARPAAGCALPEP
jgi:hypothetical protein